MATSHDESFAKLVDQFTRFMLKQNPVDASFLGIHEHDQDLPSFAPSVMTAKTKRLESLKKQFKDVNKRRLSLDNQVDLELIIGRIETELLLDKKNPAHKLLPDLYINSILLGVYVVISRDFDTPRVRALAATRRLASVPALLKQAKANLKQPPGIFVESAIETCTGAIKFLEDSIPEFANEVRGSLKEVLLEVSDEAIVELESFREYLEQILPKAKATFPVGKATYNQIVKTHHQLNMTHDKLQRLARKVIRETEAELIKTARQIRKGTDWKDQAEKLKKEHPTGQGLLGAYRREIKNLRNFTVSEDIASIPEGSDIAVQATPSFLTPVIPFATYLSPAPFDENQSGIIWVTVPTGLAANETGQRLKGHPKAGIPVFALHEGYPGHHLQQSKANENKNLVRHLATSSVFSEGWALYSEELMFEMGYLDNPKQRLLQLRDKLFRACRVLIDVGLQTKTINFTQAVKMLVDKVGLEPPNAEAEVRRYCQNPTQPMSYLVGMNEIISLRDAYKKKRGKNFSLREFHDELLSHGSIPIPMIRKLMEL